GRYSVIVKQGGCIGSQLGVEVLVAATEFVNGSFEEPFAGDIDCGPPPAPVPGLPTGWNTDSNLHRDGNSPIPPSCPNPNDMGHYGFMSDAGAASQRAWQTIAVDQGNQYTFSGEFGGLNGDHYI